MSVSFYTCSMYGESYPDCGESANCIDGHGLCSRCMPRDAERDHDGFISHADCPVCKEGGTELERALRRVDELEAQLSTLHTRATNVMRYAGTTGGGTGEAHRAYAVLDEYLARLMAVPAKGAAVTLLADLEREMP